MLMADTLTPEEIRDVKRRANLYMDYLEELERIQGVEFDATAEERAEWIIDYMTLSCYEWYDIMDGERIEGFVIIGVAPDCHPNADVSMQQAYITRKFRRRGITRRAVMEVVEDAGDGVYCLIIIRNNDVAKSFWDNVYRKLGYRRVRIPEIEGLLEEGDEQRAYAPINF